MTAEVKFSTEFFASPNSGYNRGIAEFCAVLSMVGYDIPLNRIPAEETGIYKMLSQAGMENIKFDMGTGAGEVDGIFASLHTEYDSEPTALIVLCFVGSHHGQWYNNFEAGTAELHKGFDECEKIEYRKAEEYFKAVRRENERLKIVVTGHSRGAAVGGILAAHLIKNEEYAKAGDVFAYTFASPSYIRNCTEDYPIFNFVNNEDFVVRCMPEKWGYGRYGKTVALPNKTEYDGYDEILKTANSYYSRCTAGGEFVPFKNGTQAVDKLVNVICDNVKSIDEYYNKEFRTPEGRMSLKTYFFKSLCTVTAETDCPERRKPGLMLLIKSTMLRHKSSKVIRAAADFFVIYEGLGGIVKGDLFRNWFSSTHDMCTYCALLMAYGEKNNEK